ncbi:MAG: molybdopterin cofactor-binding domain-containing protein [Burkholderiaceae bacterium]
MTTTLSRRQLLQSAGFLSLAFGIPLETALSQQPARLPGDLQIARMLRAWLRIESNNQVTLLVGKVELGQGILTAILQICADEMDISLEQIKVISGDTSLVPDEGVTAGSFSMPNCATAVRHASAEVRAILLGLASEKLNQPIASLKVLQGVITSSNGASVRYGDLVIGQALEREATGQVPLKPASDHRFIGRSVPRPDIHDKVMGKSIFVQEMRLPGMLHAQVVRPPTYGAKLKTLSTANVEKMPGVVKVVRMGSFIGVVAQRIEQAHAAAQALAQAATWDVPQALPRESELAQWLRNAPHRLIETKKQVRNGGEATSKKIKATYFRPYQMHASIGTSAAIATFSNDQLVVQTHSQSVFETRTAIAKMLRMPVEKVRLQHVQGSGCYGHNMADDAAADAALFAIAVPGSPVKLQYTREQEHLWEPYGSAMLLEVEASVDIKGDVLDWNFDIYSTPHGTRPQGEAGNLLSALYLDPPFQQPVPANGGPPNYAADRNGIALYDFAGHQVLTHFITQMPLRASSHRGLGAYANVFAIESFMDELAHAAGVDPVVYRLRFLKDPRGRDAITEAAKAFGWDRWQRRPGRGRGIGFARYKNIAGYCAVALEVEVNATSGNVRVIKAVVSADCGHIVNPDGVANQHEGGLIQSLSWTLKEEVHFDETQVLSSDWSSYPILGFNEVPPVEVVLINRPGAPFLGIGEAAQGPTGAALANAVFDATRVRYRQLPLTPQRILDGLKK